MVSHRSGETEDNFNNFFILNLFSLYLTAGNYEGAVEASNSAAAITSVLYPNDNTYVTH